MFVFKKSAALAFAMVVFGVTNVTGQELATAESDEGNLMVGTPESFDAEDNTTDDETKSEIFSEIGIGVTAGAYVLGFTSDSLNDSVDVGGGWAGRVTIGTRLPVAAEFSYVGSINNISDPNNNLALTSNGVDGKVRVQLPVETIVMPYVFGGAGWKNYDAVNFDDGESATLIGEDNVLELPVGAGLSFKYNNILIDARATYRPAFFANTTDDSATITENNFDNLSAGANVGVEF